MSNETQERFQLTQDMAEAYERHFVPAFFAQWAPQLVEAAGIRAGQRVLDVACGTGIVARTAAPRVGTAGSVDWSRHQRGHALGRPAGLAGSRMARKATPPRCRSGTPSSTPVLSQMAMMFFPDPAAALREMARVVRPAGTVAILIPAGLDANPAYRPSSTSSPGTPVRPRATWSPRTSRSATSTARSNCSPRPAYG